MILRAIALRSSGSRLFRAASSVVVRQGSAGGSGSSNARSISIGSMQDHLKAIELAESVEPIAYSPNVSDTSPHSIEQQHLEKQTHKKVSIVGCGQVGMGIAFALINQSTAAGTVALVDRNESKLRGEANDLEQGSAFHENIRVIASTDYDVTANSHLVIVTAGVAQKPGESRLNLVEKNVAVMKKIIPNILKHSPNAAICIVSNPCDIMSAVAAKVAGPDIPAGRIFGSGTCLDSSRLQSLLAKSLDIDAQSVSGYVVGEHGDHSVPLWSSVHIGGVPILCNSNEQEDPPAVLDAIHRQVVDSAYDVIARKGYTNWAVGLTGAFIAKAVLNDQGKIFPVSTCVRGLYGVEQDVFLSMPCTIGAYGVRRVYKPLMTELERHKFKTAADTIWNVQSGVWSSV